MLESVNLRSKPYGTPEQKRPALLWFGVGLGAVFHFCLAWLLGFFLPQIKPQLHTLELKFSLVAQMTLNSSSPVLGWAMVITVLVLQIFAILKRKTRLIWVLAAIGLLGVVLVYATTVYPLAMAIAEDSPAPEARQ